MVRAERSEKKADKRGGFESGDAIYVEDELPELGRRALGALAAAAARAAAGSMTAPLPPARST
ncbi:hypothetical protein GPECTOR_3g399 [Gonium pectorale]|uniref:Uncharacterized protein n=1 Tax=Gonium pectorale TaxID=33097 RepID=A0A150H116_GONPE|nr:hypothetical protein GPECTOR_3g399 [Gonium pectorale]|eukprot:KXZ55260.1 hypothetical protein GPECTOR_3g399 [Gonium pectorale]